MAVGKYGETLQAVQIGSDTFIGTASNVGGPGSLVHVLDDGDVTFHFKSEDKQITGVKAGADLVAGIGCTGITSTSNVIIS